eukprot:m.203927 g.203927  ORF g.203927 m.203927 type:complete len:308 (+) comp17740_c2_seq1:3118-4041(+)
MHARSASAALGRLSLCHRSFATAAAAPTRLAARKRRLIQTFTARVAVGTAVGVAGAVVASSAYWTQDAADCEEAKRRDLAAAAAAAAPTTSTPNSADAAATSGWVEDPLSHVRHPPTLRVAVFPTPLTLVGVGTRTVTFMRFQVYSAGLYVQPDGVRKAARAHPPTDASTTSGELSMQFLEQLYQQPRALRVSPVREAEFSHLRDGFARALETRVPSSLSPDDKAKCADDIKVFKQMFPRGAFKIGEELVFSVKGDEMFFEYQGQKVGQLKSGFVCRTLFSSYLEKNAVSTNAHAAFVDGLAKMVAA